MYLDVTTEKALAFLIDYITLHPNMYMELRNDPDQRGMEAMARLLSYTLRAKRKRATQNQRAWDAIRERRKHDPDYARPKK